VLLWCSYTMIMTTILNLKQGYGLVMNALFIFGLSVFLNLIFVAFYNFPSYFWDYFR
jgi:hypothetical protein